METQGRCYVRFLAGHGENAVRDDMSRTVLRVNDAEYGPESFAMPAIAVGDVVEIRVPTGTLSLTVERAGDDLVAGLSTAAWAGVNHIAGPFRWSGAFNALRHGQSGVATWRIDDMADVTTSAWPEPVPFDVYKRAHGVADAMRYSPLAGVRHPLLEQSIRFVLERDTAAGPSRFVIFDLEDDES